MSTTNNFVFKSLKLIVWIIFIALCFEAGGLLVNFAFSLVNPEYIPHLYQKLDLSNIYNISKATFFLVYGFILAIAILKAYLFYIVIRLMKKLDLILPFTNSVSGLILKIGYLTLTIGLVSVVFAQIGKKLMHHGYFTDNLNQFWEGGQAFILMGAVIYIIAGIFKKGLEIQNENDLTV